MNSGGGPVGMKGAQKGIGLVEVLLAVVIFSVGVLGVAKLMFGTMKSTDSAYFRTEALFYAYGILDVMRSNRIAAVSQGYDTGTGLVTSSTNCSTTTCTQAQMATYDLSVWKAKLIGTSTIASVLPGGDGTIVTTTTGGATTAVITVYWDDSRAGGSNQASVVLETVL